MIEERQIRALIEQADRSRRAHDWQSAITLLKKALALDPEHAQAHASLALALLGARRLHGANLEVELALAFDGNDPYCHYAGAAVRCAQRKLEDAWQHCLVALHADNADADTHVLGADIQTLKGDRKAARNLLDDALAIDGNHIAALSDLAHLDLLDGEIIRAQQRIDLALAADPSDIHAHVIAGYIALQRSDVEDAETHARYVLEHDAAGREALELWTAVKARRNVLLGVWWRLNAFVSMRSERTGVAILIGSFVVVRLAVLLLGLFGYESLEMLLTKVWLAFCAYTWFAPEIFKWMLERELKSVVLRDDY